MHRLNAYISTALTAGLLLAAIGVLFVVAGDGCRSSTGTAAAAPRPRAIAHQAASRARRELRPAALRVPGARPCRRLAPRGPRRPQEPGAPARRRAVAAAPVPTSRAPLAPRPRRPGAGRPPNRRVRPRRTLRRRRTRHRCPSPPRRRLRRPARPRLGAVRGRSRSWPPGGGHPPRGYDRADARARRRAAALESARSRNRAVRFCTSRSCWSERWCPPGNTIRRLGSPRRLVELLAGRVGHALVALGVQQQQRGARRQAGGRAQVQRAQPLHRGRRRPPRSPPGRRRRSRAPAAGGAGQMAATAAIDGSAAAAWMARKPPMLDPRSADRGRVLGAARRAWPARRPPRRARSARRAPVAAGVEGQRGQAAVTADAAEVEVALLARPGAVQDHHASGRGPPSGRNSAYESPSCSPSSGGAGGSWCFILADPMSTDRTVADRGSALPSGLERVYPMGSDLGPGGALRIAGCDARELAREFGTPAYVYAEDDLRARARATRDAFAARTDRFEVLYASKAFPATAALRIFAEEGLSVDCASGGELHLALNAGLRPRADLPARQQQVRGRAGAGGRGRRRPRDRGLLRRDRAAGAGRGRPRPADPDARHARHRARDPQGHPHRPGGLQVRHPHARRGAGAGADRALGPGAARAARAHRLAGVRPGRVRVAGRRAAPDRRLPAAEPGRRLRHRLHARGPPAAGRGVRRGDAGPRARRA